MQCPGSGASQVLLCALGSSVAAGAAANLASMHELQHSHRNDRLLAKAFLAFLCLWPYCAFHGEHHRNVRACVQPLDVLA
jgi:hypothetical protein